MVHDLRSALRAAQNRQGQPRAVILDGRTLPFRVRERAAAGYDG